MSKSQRRGVLGAAVENVLQSIWGATRPGKGSRSLAPMGCQQRSSALEPLEGRVLFTWTGATSGTTVDAAHDYNNLANWAGGIIDDSFAGVNFTGNTTLYLSSNRTTTASGLNLGYNNNFDLTILSNSSTTRTLTLAGDVIGDFGGSASARTVTLGNTTNPVTLNFGATGRTLTVSGSTDSLVLSNTVTGGGTTGLYKAGPGTLSLLGTNTYSGGTTLHEGKVSFTSGGLNTTGNITFDGTSTLNWNGTNLDLSGRIQPIPLNVTATLQNATNPVVFSKPIGGAGNIIKWGASSLTLNAAYALPTGFVRINNGTLRLGDGDALRQTTLDLHEGDTGTLSFGALTAAKFAGLQGSRGLSLNNDSQAAVALQVGTGGVSTTYSGILSGAGDLTKRNAGVFTLTGAGSTRTGATYVLEGTLCFGAGALGGTGNISFTGSSTLQWYNDGVTGNSDDISSRLQPIQAGMTATFDTNGNNVILSSPIRGTGGAIAKTGDGMLSLTAANTYDGGTTLSGGTLDFVNGALGTGSVTFASNATLRWRGTNTQDISAQLRLPNAGVTATFNTFTNNVTFGTGLAGAGSILKAGTGTLTLSGVANNTFTGTTRIGAGTLALGYFNGCSTALMSSTLDLDGTDAGAISFGGNTSVHLGGLAGSRPLAMGNVLLWVGENGFDTLYEGVLSGGAEIWKDGNGTLTLTGNNTCTGDISIVGGTLQLGDGLNHSGAVAGDIWNCTGLVFANPSDQTFAGVIDGLGSVTKSGSGKLTLTGNNTYGGTTTITSGTLQVGSGGTTGTLGSGPVVNNGSLVFNRSDAVTVANVITGGGSVVQQGGGTLTFTGLVAPGNLRVVPLSSTTLNITWSDLTKQEDGTRVEYSSDGGQTYVTATTLARGVRNYVLSGLQPDTPYMIRVTPYLNSPPQSAPQTITEPVRTLPAGTDNTYRVTISKMVHSPGAGLFPTDHLSVSGTPVQAASWLDALLQSVSGWVWADTFGGAPDQTYLFKENGAINGAFKLEQTSGGYRIWFEDVYDRAVNPANINYRDDYWDVTFADGTTPKAPPSKDNTGGDPVRYSDGALELNSEDLPAGVAGWGQTRSFSNQINFHTGAAVAGNNWIITQRSYLRQLDGDNSIMVVDDDLGGRWFSLSGGVYSASFEGRDSLQHTGTEFVLTNADGSQAHYYDFSVTPAAKRGQFDRLTDAAGNTITTTYAGDGSLTEVRISNHDGVQVEKYAYTYLSGSIQNITMSTFQGTWQTVRQVAYTYYGVSESFGNAGDLKTAIIKDASGNVIETKYYRYYVPDIHGQVANGYVGGVKYVFDGQDYARLAAAFASPQTATDAEVAPYARLYLEYDGLQRVTKETVAGMGATNGQGTLGYDYGVNPSIAVPDGSATNTWYYKNAETLPDGNQNIVYSNAAGEMMLRVFVDLSDPANPELSGTFAKYDAAGRVLWQTNASALNLPSSLFTLEQDPVLPLVQHAHLTLEQYPDLLHSVNGNYEYLNDASGAIDVTTYYTQTTATETLAGGAAGYLATTAVQQGEFGTSILQSTTQYFLHAGGGSTIYPTANYTVYRNDDGTGAQPTRYEYGWMTDSTQMLWQKTVLPVVSTAQNGSGQENSSTSWNDALGRTIWQKDAGGFLTYTGYDAATGAVVKSIVDVDTAKLTAPELLTLPSGWTTPTGGGLHLVTSYEVDTQGRTTKETDPAGRITYTVYNDLTHEVRTYRGWNATTHLPTGPIEVYRSDTARGYTESLTSSATPTLDASYRPTGLEVLSASNIQSLSRSYTNTAGQTIYQDVYTSLAGVTYSTSASLTGAQQGVNYLRTTYSYGGRGWRQRTQSPDGTIRFTSYDDLGQTIGTYVGTDDNEGTWLPGTNPVDPVNMVQVSGSAYDADGNVITTTSYASDTDNSTSTYRYDWRGRLTDSRSADGLIAKQTYDNLGQVTRTQSYVDADGDWTIDSGELRSQSDSLYDDQGRVYRQVAYEIDPGTHAAADRLTSNVWYDARGNTAKTASASGVFQKSSYDGAGRLISSYVSYDTDETSYAEAMGVAGDTVLEQSRTWYDKSGYAVVQARYQRLESDSITTGDLTAANSYATSSVAWYDLAGRQTVAANIGHESPAGTRYVFASNGTLIDANTDGIPDIAAGSALQPNTSDDYIVSKVDYDAAGNVWRRTDNAGRVTQTEHDLAARTTFTIENYVNGVVTETEASDTDRTTEYVYDLQGRLNIQRALNPLGVGRGVQQQNTRYLYESTLTGSLQTDVIYPDSADTTSAGTDHVKFNYDRLGRKLTSTDQRGVVHSYAYDSVGRLLTDTVTTLSAGVDGSVRRIEYGYQDDGKVSTITSYDAVTGGNIVNQVKYTYDGWGNVTKSQQSHSGAVAPDSPSTQYVYEDGAVGTEAQFLRLRSMTYPGGRTIYYNYESTPTGRLLSLSEDAAAQNILATYSYLGAGTIVKETRPSVSGGLNLSYGANGTYAGWDRFGRTLSQEWRKDDNTLVDGYGYTYNRAGDRVTKTHLLNSALSETYAYDGLSRLTDTNRGGTDLQNWSLDALGNWDQFIDGATTQTRDQNAANETTDISGTWIDPTYDAAGNMTSGPMAGAETTRLFYVYDAWNRLVQVKADNNGQPGAVIATYQYDGRGFRTRKTLADATTFDYYQNDGNQTLEIRKNGSANAFEQYVYDQRYIDAPVMVYRDTNTDGTVDQKLYVTQDANFNVTATVDGTTGGVVNRFVYTPYGQRTVLTSTWTAGTTDFLLGHQGLYLDGESGLYYNRARYLHSTLGNFIQRDPLGYVDGMNVYGYENATPVQRVDPQGTMDITVGSIGSRIFERWTARMAGGITNIFPGLRHILVDPKANVWMFDDNGEMKAELQDQMLRFYRFYVDEEVAAGKIELTDKWQKVKIPWSDAKAMTHVVQVDKQTGRSESFGAWEFKSRRAFDTGFFLHGAERVMFVGQMELKKSCGKTLMRNLWGSWTWFDTIDANPDKNFGGVERVYQNVIEPATGCSFHVEIEWADIDAAERELTPRGRGPGEVNQW